MSIDSTNTVAQSSLASQNYATHMPIVSVFSKWSEEDTKKSKQEETKSAKLWRKVGRFAGLQMPYGVEAYNELIQKYGSVEQIKRCWFPDNFQSLMVGKVRGHDLMPFDIYTLIKQGSMAFIVLLVFCYAFVLCGTFALLASPAVAGCFDVDGFNFFAKGFLLVSGLGHGLDQSNTCLWIEVGGTLIGVYITLPVVGAIVLVRLLDNTAISFAMSHVALLGLRNGRPIISVRSISKTGLLYGNRDVKMYWGVKNMDSVTGESYGDVISLHFDSPNIVQPFAIASTYTLETDEDPLFKRGVVYYDAKGRCKWNFKRLAVCWYTMSADKEGGSRSMSDTKFFIDLEHHLINCDDETGAYPLWKSCSSSMAFEYWTSQGQKTTVSDLNLLSSWEYSPKQVKDHAEKTKKEEEGSGGEETRAKRE